MPIIIINRPEQWTNYLRNYKVYIDDEIAGTIRNGKTGRFYVEPGEHTLQVRIEWVGSPLIQLDLASDEIRTFRVRAIEYGRILNVCMTIILILFFFFPPPFLNIPDYFLLSLIVLSILLVVYHTTIGRNDFLELKEIENDPEIWYKEQAGQYS